MSTLRNASVAKRIKSHIEKDLKEKYVVQMTSQLVSVLQRISSKRVSARTLLKDDGQNDTLGLSSSVSNSLAWQSLSHAYDEDAKLLAEVMGRAHSEVYMPLILLLREVKADSQLQEEPWVRMVERIAEALFTDITVRESIVADLGPTLEGALEVSKEALRLYISAVSTPHQALEADGYLMKRTIELVNLCC